jgi:hypothetical protein
MMDEATGPESTEGYITVWEAAKNLKLSANSLQQMGSRGVITTTKIGNRLYIPEEFLSELEAEYPIENIS